MFFHGSACKKSQMVDILLFLIFGTYFIAQHLLELLRTVCEFSVLGEDLCIHETLAKVCDLSKLNASLFEKESEILRHIGGCKWYWLQIGIVIDGHY